MKITDILTPALVLDRAVFMENIALMKTVMEKTNIALRPHYKSHKSIKIANIQILNGAKGITCAKLGEAEDLANAGIKDILIANQVTTTKKMGIVTELCKKSKITLCVDNLENINALNSCAEEAGVNINIFVEFNIGQNRCGVDTYEEFYALAKAVSESKHLTFGGIEAYAGHLAHQYDYEKRMEASAVIEKTLKGLKMFLEERNIIVKEVSGVSTGTIRFRETWDSVYTETQPGSYIFMDNSYTPVNVGFKNSLFILSTVVSTKKDLVVTDAGLKSASVDMGSPVLITPDGTNLPSSVSEEHISHKIENHNYKINNLVMYIPSHCCTTVNLYDVIYVVDGDEVVDIFEVDSRGKAY